MSDQSPSAAPESSAAPLLQDAIEIGAPLEQVWELVKDVRRMADWSPQVSSTRLRKGFDQVELGAQFTSLNSEGGFDWVTHGEVVRYEDQQELAFRIEENWVIWSYALERAGANATRLTQRRDTPEGVSPLSKQFTENYPGGTEAFTASMRAGMRQTLENIKSQAER
ncbi:SRPBCC family protein [Nocardia sp. NPDC003693]